MHDTYLNGARHGWPHDHSVDDAYECPPHTWKPEAPDNIFDTREYAAVFDGKGRALLVLNEDKQTTIATFDTFADAQTAAEALNNHKGY